MTKLNSIFKIILESVLIFLIFYIWLNFYLNSPSFASIFSLILTGITEGVYQGFKQKKSYNTYLKEKEKTDADKMFLSLVKNEKNIDFFAKLFLSRHKDVHKHKDFIVVEKNDQKIAIYPMIKYQKINNDDIIIIQQKLKKIQPTKIIIPCNDAEIKSKDFAKTYLTPIKILDRYKTYALIYKEYEFYPEITEEKESGHSSLKVTLSKFFSRSHASGFILSAVFLLLGSFFTKMNLYYLISTSVLLAFGVVCLFNNSTNSSKSSI